VQGDREKIKLTVLYFFKTKNASPVIIALRSEIFLIMDIARACDDRSHPLTISSMGRSNLKPLLMACNTAHVLLVELRVSRRRRTTCQSCNEIMVEGNPI